MRRSADLIPSRASRSPESLTMLIGATLGAYFSRQFLKTIFLVFATVFTLVYTLDFVELMRRAGDAESATPALIAQLALFRTPAIAEQVMPFAVLFGSMAALLQLSRKLELVVARAAGISAWQFLQPGLLVALADRHRSRSRSTTRSRRR